LLLDVARRWILAITWSSLLILAHISLFLVLCHLLIALASSKDGDEEPGTSEPHSKFDKLAH